MHELTLKSIQAYLLPQCLWTQLECYLFRIWLTFHINLLCKTKTHLLFKSEYNNLEDNLYYRLKHSYSSVSSPYLKYFIMTFYSSFLLKSVRKMTNTHLITSVNNCSFFFFFLQVWFFIVYSIIVHFFQ